jgi:outer membrane scaffolding protein for murein synthesis (MipA/OmpV family)
MGKFGMGIGTSFDNQYFVRDTGNSDHESKGSQSRAKMQQIAGLATQIPTQLAP